MADDSASPIHRVEIVERQRLVDDFFQLDAIRYRVPRSDGTLSAPTRRLVLERGDSVAALLVDGDTAWLVEQFRVATHQHGDGWLLELAAGIIGKDETPESALRREVVEETGFELGSLEHLGRFYLSPGACSERVDLFLAPVIGRIAPGGGVEAEGEFTQVAQFTRAGLQDAWRSGRLIDAKTAIAVMRWLRDS